MTIVLFDADSLIKLTKAGAKEVIVKHLDVIIPGRVKEECVDEAQGKPDAVLIEQNIDKNKIKVAKTKPKDSATEKEIQSLNLYGGEQDLYRLSTQMSHDLLSSDDQKFLRLLQNLQKKAVTSSSLIVLLYKKKKINQKQAHELLSNLRKYVSEEEYELCKQEIGGEP